HEVVEAEALDPAHLEDGEPGAVDADALFEVAEGHHEGAGVVAQVVADGLVALAQAVDLAGEALDGPGLLAGAKELVDVGEVARVRARQVEEGVGGGPAVAQL